MAVSITDNTELFLGRFGQAKVRALERIGAQAGQRAQPYLKPAAQDHKQTYYNIIKDEMKNG